MGHFSRAIGKYWFVWFLRSLMPAVRTSMRPVLAALIFAIFLALRYNAFTCEKNSTLFCLDQPSLRELSKVGTVYIFEVVFEFGLEISHFLNNFDHAGLEPHATEPGAMPMSGFVFAVHYLRERVDQTGRDVEVGYGVGQTAVDDIDVEAQRREDYREVSKKKDEYQASDKVGPEICRFIVNFT